MTNRSAACFAVLLAVVSAGDAAVTTLDCGPLLDKLRKGAKNEVEFELLGKDPYVYRAWGVWRIPHPFRSVTAVALDFAGYPRTFNNVYECTRVTTPPRLVSPIGTWYLEGRAGVARVWAIGNIDSLSVTRDSSELHLVASQNENRVLEAQWRQVLPGWINFRLHGLKLAAFVVADGRNACRVGVIAQALVSKPMPEWLCKMAVDMILPRILQDLDEEIARRTNTVQKHHWWW